VLRADFDPVAIARIYADNGVSAISVLTDELFFQGRLEYLTAIRQAVALPLLRKDFIIDAYQVLESRVAGADAVLLIAEILNDQLLRSLLEATSDLGMEALVELYEPENLPRVLDSGARIVGVNNRNLRTFETRLEHTLAIVGKASRDVCLVSESGIRTREDLERLQSAGVKAVLIGETLMRAPDIGAKLRELQLS
jgi:indole-3-glycerol phosphate synthase